MIATQFFNAFDVGRVRFGWIIEIAELHPAPAPCPMSAIVRQYVFACAIGRSCDSLSFWLRDVLDINGSLFQVMVLFRD
jgi:hypothetical protein